MRQKWEDLWGIDTRALGVFRISLALILLGDLLTRCADFQTFYTDSGLLPRADLLTHAAIPSAISVHLMSGNPWIVGFLLAVQVLCAIGLLIGYRTSWMTFWSWFLLASLQRRAPMILGGGDDYLRLLLFWSLFLPLGATYSFDSARRPAAQQVPRRFLSWGSAAMLLQTLMVYLMTGIQKWRGIEWHDGSAIYYALNIDGYARAGSLFLLNYPAFLKLMTHAVLGLELVGALLLFSPFFTRVVRTMMACSFILMHISFFSLMYLKLFPLVSITAMLLFLPISFWDFLFQTTISARPTPPRGQSRWAGVLAAFFLFSAIASGLAELAPTKIKISEPLHRIIRMTYVEQSWKLFAPSPLKSSGWLVIDGQLKNGTHVDLFRQGQPLNWDKPTDLWGVIHNERWRKFMIGLHQRKHRALWPVYAHYWCRSWNARHEGWESLDSLEMVFMTRKTLPDNAPGTYVKESLLRYSCSRGLMDQVPSDGSQENELMEGP